MRRLTSKLISRFFSYALKYSHMHGADLHLLPGSDSSLLDEEFEGLLGLLQLLSLLFLS